MELVLGLSRPMAGRKRGWGRAVEFFSVDVGSLKGGRGRGEREEGEGEGRGVGERMGMGKEGKDARVGSVELKEEDGMRQECE